MNGSRAGWDRVTALVALAATIALGLAAGAMLAEGAVLVPYWRSLPADAFLAWYTDNASRLLDFYGPLELVSAVLALAAAGLSLAKRRPGAGALLLAALLSCSVLVAYPLYFRDVNASFAQHTIRLADVPGELARWAAWHWARTAIGTAAFVATLFAARRVR
jgi:hypothetical protein